MKISDFRIGTKLIVGFIGVIAIFGAAIYYQIRTLQDLAVLQDEGAKRSEDALAIKAIDNRVGTVYTVIADGVINRDFEKTQKDFEEVKALAQQDIAIVRELVDTVEEEAWVETFVEQYSNYLEQFEKEMLPILEKGESTEKWFADALAINTITGRVNEAYTVIADAVINRDFEETMKDFKQIKTAAQQDIVSVQELVDTAEENAWATTFADQYMRYLELFEQRMLPLLQGVEYSNWDEIRRLDDQIDELRDATLAPLQEITKSLEQESFEANQDTVKIRELDGKIDALRVATMTPLDNINQSLVQESIEADAIFDTTRQRAIQLATVISVSGSVIALLIAFAITFSITRPLREAVMLNNKLAEGNLNLEINVKRKDEIGQLQTAMQHMVEKLREVVLNVQSGAMNVASGSEEMSQGASEQAASAEEASSSMEEMVANIQQNTDNALQTEKIAVKAATDAQESGMAVAQTVDAMHEIVKKIGVIEEIARQTHMLSLNATIEAAKAEQYGKGFAVVAAEVRALASRAQDAAGEINAVASDSIAVAEKAGEMLYKLVPDIQKTAELVQEISAASKEQTSGAGQINQAIQQLDQVVQQNAAVSEELAAQAEQLQSTMAFFNTEGTGRTTTEHDLRVSRTQLGAKVAHIKARKDAETGIESGDGAGSAGYVMNLRQPKREEDELDDEFERY